MERAAHTCRLGLRGLRRIRALSPSVAVVTGGLLLVCGVAPAPAHAVDLFPVDDWIGDGLKSIGKIALGPLKLGAEAIAKLLGAIVAALADLLVPKSLIEAGLGAIKWLVQLPPLGSAPSSSTGPSGQMLHLRELRDTLTWIGLTLLPLQLVVAGGRSLLSPTVEGDSPTEVLERTLAAALGLIAFDWLWGSATELVRLVTRSLLSLPWVADGVERMLEALVIGGATGTAVAAEFVVPLLLAIAGAVLLALMLLRIGLEVIASLVYVTGGLALGLSVSGAGARLLQAWTVAATAAFVLPVLWCVVFVCGAALMLDADTGEGGGGFGGFVAQLYNIGAALVTFGVAIKLARATLGHAGTAITGLAAASRISGRAGGRPPIAAGAAPVSAPQSLARFSQSLRGGVRGAAVGAARVGAFPLRHPVSAASYVRRPVQASRAAAEHVASSARAGAAGAAATDRSEDRQPAARQRRSAPTNRAADPAPRPGRASTGRSAGAPDGPPPATSRPGRTPRAPEGRSVAPPDAGGAATRPPALTSAPSADRAVADAWRTTRRVAAPARRTGKRKRRKK
jgi:hypothetical protein